MKIDNSIYYSYNKVMTYNSMLNFIIGERGVGKTYGLTKFLIKRFLKKGKKFAYVRRYKTELKSAVPKFFEKMIENNEFPNHEFSYSAGCFYIDDEICGYYMPLSNSMILKGNNFNDVDIILFDEFIIEKGTYHYLKNEVDVVLNLCETISRLRDFKMFFLGNAISIANPYFSYFNLSLPYKSDIKTFKNGLILINYIKNEKYREIKRRSKFGQLVKGTPYEKHAIDNEFFRDSKSFVEKMHNSCKHIFVIVLNGQKYGCYYDSKTEKMYISNKYDVYCPIELALSVDDHNEETYLTRSKTSVYYSILIESYKNGLLRFETQKIKSNFQYLLEKWL